MKTELVEKGLVLEIKNGSFLYGLNTKKSDVDYMGVFFAPKEYILGLKHVEQVDLSVVDKLENGKNSKDAVDRVFYEAKRFIKMCLEGAPNIIETLFVNEDNIVRISDFGRKLLDNKHLFVSEKIIPKMMGFAHSQKKKLIIKTSNMKDLIGGLQTLKNYMAEGYEKETLPEFIGKSEFDKYFKEKSNKLHFQIGCHSINRNMTIKATIKQLEEIVSNTSHRLSNIEKSGYEHKYASHLLRLIFQTTELMLTGTLAYPLQRREEILKVKKGEVSYDDFLKMLEKAELEMEEAKENNVLPKLPNYDVVEKLLIEGYKEYLQEVKC